MKIGILGGTFNPIHLGHIQMTQFAIKNYGFDKVVILPSGNPPHKNSENLLSGHKRYEMCLLATVDHDNLIVESLEIERKGTTYTIDSLEYFSNIYSNNSIYYIIGGDTVLHLNKWKQFEKVFKLCKFIAFLREGYDNSKILNHAKYLKKQYNLDITFDYQGIMDVSSSDIRNKIANNVDVSEFIPKRVIEYIYEYKIYK